MDPVSGGESIRALISPLNGALYKRSVLISHLLFFKSLFFFFF